MNKLAKLGIFLLIFLNLLPGGFVRDTVEVGHFFSSIHMFEYAFNHGFQFGVDIIDNVGPYGYLHYPYVYAGGAFGAKTLWFAIICFVYAYYATSLTKRIRSWPERLLFLFSVIFFSLQVAFPWYSFEVIPRLAILFSAIYFLTESREKISWRENVHIIFNGFFYAFLTLEKASNVYYLALLIFILSAYWFSRSRWQNVFWLVGSYLSGIAIFWLAAGQHLSALPTYFESMSFFINAYQEVLGQEMGMRNFRYGLFYCVVAAALIIFRLRLSLKGTRPQKELPEEIFRSVLVAALCFLTWKHGMLRSVFSYGTFLYTAPIIFAYLCFFPTTTTGKPTEPSFLMRFSSWPAWILRSTLFVVLLLIVWSNVASYENEINQKVEIVREFSARFSALVHYRPAQTLKDLDAKLEKLKHENALPLPLKMAMQSGRVDEFGTTPEILLLNDLDYRPRPVPITLIAGNSALNGKNGRYYQNPVTAPDFVLIEEFGLRSEDTLAYLSLLFNYQAVQTFKNWLVMEKRFSNWQSLALQKLPENQSRFDEWVSLAELQKSFLWVEIEAEPSMLGKMKRFFYKPDSVRLDILLNDGTTRSVPFSLAQLRSGFLINPVIRTRADVKWSILDKNEVPWDLAKAFRITLDAPKKSRLFQQEFKVKFSVVASRSPADANLVPVDLSKARSLVNLFAPSFPVTITKFPVNLFANEPRNDIDVTGLSGLESNGKESWRWATGPATHIMFFVDPASTDQARQLRLKFAFKNGVPILGQSVTIRLNGKVVRRFSSEEIAMHELTDADVALAANKGFNVLEIVYKDWVHDKKDISNDPRQLAVVFMHLSLQSVNK